MDELQDGLTEYEEVEIGNDEAEELAQEVEEEANSNSEEITEQDVNSEENLQEEKTEEETPSEEELAKRAEFAEKKRQEKAQKQVDKAVENGEAPKLEGKQPKVNPFTGLPIEDDDDKAEYLEQLEATSRGYDPKSLADMSKFRKEQRAEARKLQEQEAQAKATAKAKADEFISNDKKAFTEKYPDVNINDIIHNETFRTIAKGRVGKESIVAIYEDFKSIDSKYSQKIQQEKEEALARAESSPGSLTSSTEIEDKPFDYKQWERDAMAGRLD